MVARADVGGFEMMTRKDFQVFAEEIGEAMNEMMSEYDQLVMYLAVRTAAERCNPKFSEKAFLKAVEDARGVA